MDIHLLAVVVAGGLAAVACSPGISSRRQRLAGAGALAFAILAAIGHPLLTAAAVIIGVMASHSLESRGRPVLQEVVEAGLSELERLREQARAAHDRVLALSPSAGLDPSLVTAALTAAEQVDEDEQTRIAGYRQVIQLARTAERAHSPRT